MPRYSERRRAKIAAGVTRAWKRRRVEQPMTDETKEKLRAAAMGNTRRVGSRHSEDAKAKMRAAHAARRAQRETADVATALPD